MTREKAISILSLNMISAYPSNKRDEEVNAWHLVNYNKDDIDINNFSKELQFSLLNYNEIKNTKDSLFDPLIIKSIKDSFYGVKNSFILQKLKDYNIDVNSIEGKEEPLLICPCCNYKTLKKNLIYDICVVCFWEDEELFKEDNYFSDANHMTLFEGRTNFNMYGAIEKKFLPYVDKEGKDKYFR